MEKLFTIEVSTADAEAWQNSDNTICGWEGDGFVTYAEAVDMLESEYVHVVLRPAPSGSRAKGGFWGIAIDSSERPEYVTLLPIEEA